MAKRHVYTKDSHGFGDFVYVDLLPDVKRSRQFNMNVIIALLYAVVLGFFLIYRPYSAAVFQLEDLNTINSDRQHELTLVQEEFDGYKIDLDAIEFQKGIEEANKVRINFNNYLDEITEEATENQGVIQSVSYNARMNQIIVEISFPSQYYYNSLYTAFLRIDWVNRDTSLVEEVQNENNTYQYTIGVDYNVE